MIKFILTLAILFYFFVPNKGFAQNERDILQIKNSGNYYFGDGYSKNMQESIESARRDLAEKIIVNITSESSLEIEEDNTSFTSLAQMRISSLSRLQLRGLDYITNRRRDQSYHTVAFIRRSQFYESLEVEKQTLFAKLDFALQSERLGNHEQAISDYIELLARSRFFPQSVLTEPDRHGTRMELQHFARNRINTFLNELEITFDRVDDRGTSQSPELYLLFNVKHQSKPINGVWIGFHGDGFAEHIVFNGKVEVYYDQMIDRSRTNLPFRVAPRPNSNLDADLIPIAISSTPSITRQIQVNFKDVIRPDIHIEELSGGRYRFHPKFGSSFSVSEVRWEFSDGAISTEISPIHRFSGTGQPSVTMTLNRSEDLRVRRQVGAIGGVRIESPEIPARNSMRSSYTPPSSHLTHINQIMRFHSADELLAYLERLRGARLVRYGRSNDVREDVSYIAIVEISTNRIHTILSPVQRNLRYNLKTDESLADSDVRPRFRGYRVVWFQFN